MLAERGDFALCVMKQAHVNKDVEVRWLRNLMRANEAQRSKNGDNLVYKTVPQRRAFQT